MNQNQMGRLQFNLSGIGLWVVLFLGIWLLGSIGLGWLVKSFLVLIGLILIAPFIALFGFRWWLQRNVVEDQCPVCGFASAGINGTQLRCPNCSEALKVENKHFYRSTPPGTVDVQAIEVPLKQLDE